MRVAALTLTLVPFLPSFLNLKPDAPTKLCSELEAMEEATLLCQCVRGWQRQAVSTSSPVRRHVGNKARATNRKYASVGLLFLVQHAMLESS